MNFYASSRYLNVIAKVYFESYETSQEVVHCTGKKLRCLVIEGKRIITSAPFLDYHAPLAETEGFAATRDLGYVENVVQRIVTIDEWQQGNFNGFTPAPFLDWSIFSSYEDYQTYLKTRGKGILKEDARRRRRLEENFGELVFRMDDDQPDVLELAQKWKEAQLIETGLVNYFENPRNIEYFRELRRRKLLTASTLRADNRLLSLWMGFVHEGIWSGWVFAYDHDPPLKKYSVGRQLLYSMIEESYQQGHQQFDFSIGNEPYKWMFSTHVRVVGPLGVPPLKLRLLKWSKMKTKRLLVRHPKVLEKLRVINRKIASFRQVCLM